MSKQTPPKPAKAAPDPRAERLKAALKANIAKRKAQARARIPDDPAQDVTTGGKAPQP